MIRITEIIRIRIPKQPNGLDMKDYMLTSAVSIGTEV
jgi:hypothetical protein